MKLSYDPVVDALLIFILRNEPPVDAMEESGGVIMSCGEAGQ